MFVLSLRNPNGESYYSLLDIAFEICDEFYVVVRKDFTVLKEDVNIEELTFNKNAQLLLEELSPYLKNIKEQYEWPGTRLLGKKPAVVYYYHTNQDTKEILRKQCNDLFGWQHPNLPEDLSFMNNGDCWLRNTAHEGWADILTNSKQVADRVMDIMGPDVKVQEIENRCMQE